jgi:hypothetical protein
MKVTVRFLRHSGICRPMCSCFKSLDRSTAFRPGSAQTVKDAPEVLRPTHRHDEFRPAIPQRVARQQARLRFTGTPILNPFRDRPQ